MDVPYAVMPKDDSTLNKIINEGIDQALLKAGRLLWLKVLFILSMAIKRLMKT